MKNIKIYNDIVNSDLFKKEADFYQHKSVTTYDHSLFVAHMSLKLADLLNLKVNRESLIKGTLLHDYFLYDWHEDDPSHKWHGIFHPRVARDNAKRDFGLNKIEENMILSHMFPLGWVIPKYKESIILCLVDKYCATYEIIHQKRVESKIREI